MADFVSPRVDTDNLMRLLNVSGSGKYDLVGYDVTDRNITGGERDCRSPRGR